MFSFQTTSGDSDFTAYKRKNMRREIFFSDPRGATPLAGLLALATSEDTDGAEFSWLEYRYKENKATTAVNGTYGGWLPSSGSATATQAISAGATLKLQLTAGDAAKFLVNQILLIVDVKTNGASTYQNVNLRLTAIDTATDIVTGIVVGGASYTIDNAAGQVGKNVICLGNANIEGSTSGAQTAMRWPINPGNYTQIFRDPFAFARSAIQQPLEFDKTGPYKLKARETSYQHMLGLENALLWGERSKTDTNESDGTPTTRRTMGGILWYLKEFEKSGGGSFGYRPGGSALTAWDDDDKRIIEIPSTGAVTKAQFDFMLERIFRKVTTSSSEKLLLCGSGMISALNTYYENKIVVNKDMQAEHRIGFDLRTVETAHGTLHFRSHPRFNDMSWMRYDGVVLDMPNLKLRPLVGADTAVRTNIHANDFDGRKDEFFTETSLELRFPETHAWIRNFKSISA